MSLMIGGNVVASIHYTLTNDTGEILDSSEGTKPLRYLYGARNIFPGLEQALVGKTSGARLQVSVAPADAYGPVQQELIQLVPREAFQDVDSVEPGKAFEAQDAQGNTRRVVFKSVDAGQVTAEQTLLFLKSGKNIEVIDSVISCRPVLGPRKSSTTRSS